MVFVLFIYEDNMYLVDDIYKDYNQAPKKLKSLNYLDNIGEEDKFYKIGTENAAIKNT